MPRAGPPVIAIAAPRANNDERAGGRRHARRRTQGADVMRRTLIAMTGLMVALALTGCEGTGDRASDQVEYSTQGELDRAQDSAVDEVIRR
jgi:hypothetical protein